MSEEKLMPKETLNANTGMPEITDEEKENAQSTKSSIIGFIFPWIFIGIGTGIACGIHAWGDKAKYDSRIAIVNEWDLQWGYLSAFLFAYLVIVLNFYPMRFKGLIMRTSSGNLRSNPFIYVNAAEGSSESRVVMATEGDEGAYNRANRSLHHFVENSIPMVLAIALNMFVFPFPTFVLTVIFFVGRVVYVMGYSNGGYGKHAPGFILTSIAVNTLYGLLLITAIRGMCGPEAAVVDDAAEAPAE